MLLRDMRFGKRAWPAIPVVVLAVVIALGGLHDQAVGSVRDRSGQLETCRARGLPADPWENAREGNRIGVYYYPWYADDFHGGNYLREHLVPIQQPLLGEYDDQQASVIGQHLAWSRSAGVDYWVTSWWGPGCREDNTTLDHILTHPDLGSLKIAVFYETVGLTDDFTNYANLEDHLTYLAQNYFGHPSYLHIDGRPVLFVYLTRVLSYKGTLESSISTMRKAAADEGYDLFIIGDQVFGSPPGSTNDIALLDAITNYDVYGSMGATGYASQVQVDSYYAMQAGWRSLAQSVDTHFVPATSPGFNDRGVRTGHTPLSRQLGVEAPFGSLFEAMLLQARELTDPGIGRMLMVTSWNEWHEDTQIEPVVPESPTTTDDSETGYDYTANLAYEGYGERYLEILWDRAGGPPLELAAEPSDESIALEWELRVHLPVTSTWTIVYKGPEGNPISPIEGLNNPTRAFALNELTNDSAYTITLAALVGNSTTLSDTVWSIPGPHRIFLPYTDR